MLYFLFLLPSLHLVTGGFVTINGSSIIKVDYCPVNFYSLRYNQFYISFPPGGVAVCLNRFFNSSMISADDCIFMPDIAKKTYNATMETNITTLPSVMTQALANISFPLSTFKCAFRLEFTYEEAKKASFYLANFGTNSGDRTVLFTYGEFSLGMSSIFYTFVNKTMTDQAVFIWRIGQPLFIALFDLSGCRYMGKIYRLNSLLTFPNNCSRLTCNPDSNIRSYCEPNSYCDRNGSCWKTENCSVIGQNVIDSSGVVKRAPTSSCLIPLVTVGNLEVAAEFAQRVRIGLTSLDSLFFKLNRTSIHLHQGLKVHMNMRTLTLNNTVQIVENVEFYKDQSKIQVKIQASTGNVTIWFDGTEAGISILSYSKNQGLCIAN